MELGDKLEDEAMEIEEEIIMEEEEGKMMIAIVNIIPQYTMPLLSFRT